MKVYVLKIIKVITLNENIRIYESKKVHYKLINKFILIYNLKYVSLGIDKVILLCKSLF